MEGLLLGGRKEWPRDNRCMLAARDWRQQGDPHRVRLPPGSGVRGQGQLSGPCHCASREVPTCILPLGQASLRPKMSSFSRCPDPTQGRAQGVRRAPNPQAGLPVPGAVAEGAFQAPT